MPHNNKLVRNRIPDIIAGSGKEFSTRILIKMNTQKNLK